jgi:hypothetical protein
MQNYSDMAELVSYAIVSLVVNVPDAIEMGNHRM